MKGPLEILVYKIGEKAINEMTDISKRFDIDDWSNNYLEPGRMESEEAYERGRYETFQEIKNIIMKK